MRFLGLSVVDICHIYFSSKKSGVGVDAFAQTLFWYSHHKRSLSVSFTYFMAVSWLRHYATSGKVLVSRPVEANPFFQFT
jgi:hypothetical protein